MKCMRKTRRDMNKKWKDTHPTKSQRNSHQPRNADQKLSRRNQLLPHILLRLHQPSVKAPQMCTAPWWCHPHLIHCHRTHLLLCLFTCRTLCLLNKSLNTYPLKGQLLRNLISLHQDHMNHLDCKLARKLALIIAAAPQLLQFHPNELFLYQTSLAKNIYT